MKIITLAASEQAMFEDYRSPEDVIPHNLTHDGRGQLLRSPLEIRDFLCRRMAECLPRIGVIGQHHSELSTAISPMRRKSVRSEGLKEIALAEVVNC